MSPVDDSPISTPLADNRRQVWATLRRSNNWGSAEGLGNLPPTFRNQNAAMQGISPINTNPNGNRTQPMPQPQPANQQNAGTPLCPRGKFPTWIFDHPKMWTAFLIIVLLIIIGALIHLIDSTECGSKERSLDRRPQQVNTWPNEP